MGKHKPTDKQTGFWIDAELLKNVQFILKKRGVTLTSEIHKMIEKIIEEDRIKTIENAKQKK